MTSLLQDVAAVATPGARQDIVFRVKESFEITAWHSRSSDETDGKQYVDESIKVGDDSVSLNPKLPIVAAVAFTNRRGQDEVRVYYVSEKSFHIRELIRIGGQDSEWKNGKIFNQQSFPIAENSGLTANVVETPNGKTQLKLYYQREGNKLFVSYYVLSNEGEHWSSRFNLTS